MYSGLNSKISIPAYRPYVWMQSVHWMGDWLQCSTFTSIGIIVAGYMYILYRIYNCTKLGNWRI